MRIPRLLATLLSGLLLWQGTAFAVPIPLEFDPAAQTVDLGSAVSVDVTVDPAGTIIGAYDFIVNWDASILDIYSVSFGNQLGGGIDSVVDAFLLAPGSLNVSELSFLFDFTGLQTTSPFTLFTMTFEAIGLGTSALSFTGDVFGPGDDPFNYLGGEFGAPLAAAPGTGSVTVTTVAVPEPGTLLLLGAGLLALGATRRSRRPQAAD